MQTEYRGETITKDGSLFTLPHLFWGDAPWECYRFKSAKAAREFIDRWLDGKAIPSTPRRHTA